MYLLSVRIQPLGPFDNVVIQLCDEHGRARLMNVAHGAGGVGKTRLLQAVASTRPGHAIAPAATLREALAESRSVGVAEAPVRHVACEWSLGDDDPDRLHPLRVASPSLQTLAHDESETLRRREQVY